MHRAPAIDVAVSIVRAADGRVLMAERTATQLSAGFWELPGGKVDPGETVAEAAVRELAEEIGIEAAGLSPWIRYEHDFRLRRIRLHFFRIKAWRGTPHGREGQRLAWIDPAAPHVAPILPSVDRVLTALGLPPHCAVARSGEHGGPQGLCAAVDAALRAGTRLFQLRAPELAPDQRIALARRVDALARPFGARILLAGSALEARRAGLSGLHSPAADLHRILARPPVKLWTVSCRDAADLGRATQLGADAALVSPVLPSASYADRAPLGWESLRRLAAEAPLPLFAQGGLSPANLPQALAAGAAGIATSL